MTINLLSKERGIYSIYDGTKYLIFSECYGLVAKSTKIIRDNENDVVTITLDMCDWYGYWDLKRIITRGIKKLENQWIEKKVNIDVIKRNDGRQFLNEHCEIVVSEYHPYNERI